MCDILTDDVYVRYMIYVPNGSNTDVDINRYGAKYIAVSDDRAYRVG